MTRRMRRIATMASAPLALALPIVAAATAIQAPDSIRTAALVAARSALETLGPDVRIGAATLDSRLRLPLCADALDTRVDRPMGSRLTAIVSCAGPATWSVRVPVSAQVWRPVVTLTRPVPRGTILRAEHLRLAPMDLLALPRGYLTDPEAAVGMQTTLALRTDSPLAPGALAPPKLIRRGEQVTVVAGIGPVSVRGQGVAMQDGVEGARVKVRNPISGRVVEGRVTAPGRIMIQP